MKNQTNIATQLVMTLCGFFIIALSIESLTSEQDKTSHTTDIVEPTSLAAAQPEQGAKGPVQVSQAASEVAAATPQFAQQPGSRQAEATSAPVPSPATALGHVGTEDVVTQAAAVQARPSVSVAQEPLPAAPTVAQNPGMSPKQTADRLVRATQALDQIVKGSKY